MKKIKLVQGKTNKQKKENNSQIKSTRKPQRHTHSYKQKLLQNTNLKAIVNTQKTYKINNNKDRK